MEVHVKIRKLLVTAALFIPLSSDVVGQNTITPDIAGVMGSLDPILNSVTSRCPNGPMLSQQWSFSAVVAQGVKPNPFTPQLTPPGTPTEPTVVGYQQYQMYLSDRGTGHYLW